MDPQFASETMAFVSEQRKLVALTSTGRNNNSTVYVNNTTIRARHACNVSAPVSLNGDERDGKPAKTIRPAEAYQSCHTYTHVI